MHHAPIVNPSDGALLKELFTSKNGVIMCLYHDEEDGIMEDDEHQDSNMLLDSNDWYAYFSTASKQTQEQEKNQGNISAFLGHIFIKFGPPEHCDPMTHADTPTGHTAEYVWHSNFHGITPNSISLPVYVLHLLPLQ